MRWANVQGVIDSATQPSKFETSPFLAKAAAIIAHRPRKDTLKDDEALLEEWTKILPKYWQYDSETANSRDPIRITQAERLHCVSRVERSGMDCHAELINSLSTSSK